MLLVLSKLPQKPGAGHGSVRRIEDQKRWSDEILYLKNSSVDSLAFLLHSLTFKKNNN